MSSCCHDTPDAPAHKLKFDAVYHGSLAVIALVFGLYAGQAGHLWALPYVDAMAAALLDLFKSMWWGVALGIVFVGLMHQIPRTIFLALLGRGDRFSGLLRAVGAGVFFDLCSHGILMIGAKLYERGASLAQVMAFLIASPWNSFSLTLVLIGLIGLPWTLVFIVGSAIIALVSGVIFQILTQRGVLPDNPNTLAQENAPPLRAEMKRYFSSIQPSWSGVYAVLRQGLSESHMIIKWLLLGALIAAALRTFVPQDVFSDWFGPTLLGLLFTLLAATVIEVCSEGSAPIAAEIFTRAAAPGNAFAFLMAGVSTDYTEILVIRQFTGPWAVALALPIVTLPQILLLGWIMNIAGG